MFKNYQGDANMNGKKIIVLLLSIIFIGSLAGGIYLTIPAKEQRDICISYIEEVKDNERTCEKLAQIENPFISNEYYVNIYRTNAEEAQAKADEAKSTMIKYFVGSAVLIFVSLAMLGSVLCIILPSKINALPLANEEKANE